MTTGLGVAGLGGLGEALIKDAVATEGLRVVAVQDVVPGRARAVAEQYAVDWSGERFDALLGAPRVDAIVICTPNALHAAQAQAALDAGKHALVQKPLALTCGDAQATLDAARRGNRLLFVDYSYRFLDTIAVLRQHLPHTNAIRGVRATFHNIYGPGVEKRWFYEPALSGGGALTDLGVHLLDLAVWMLAPREVRLESVSFAGDGPVETDGRLLVAADGIPIQVDVSWNSPLPATQISFEVRTSEHTLRWENVDGSFFHFRTTVDGRVVAERETTLREDTLRAFKRALASGTAPSVDTRVYALLDQAYGRDAQSGTS
ncbi:MAG: Gfo/Idh/MocA family oxidoreductase [Chloroflexi bacterium]|nr:Gfo/Idh/MocA family oxidoreductase [Chloroflexota bacterium]